MLAQSVQVYAHESEALPPTVRSKDQGKTFVYYPPVSRSAGAFALAERLKRSPRSLAGRGFLLMNDSPVGRLWLAWLARRTATYDLD